MLSAERARELLDYNPETGKLTWKQGVAKNVKSGGEAGGVNNRGYRRITIAEGQYLSHRLAWLITTGVFPTDDIDHMNGDPGDNRMCNLRVATKSQNLQNQHKANTRSSTGLLGAFKVRGKYRSQIRICGKDIYLGLFNTAQEAHEAYLIKKREVHAFCMI